LNTKTFLAIFLIAGSIAIGTTTSLATPALADKSSGSNGLEKADANIHDHFGAGTDKDVHWHIGKCQGGHSTEALDALGGCDILPDPGKSGDHRQNPNNP
jgi:hypothetical protein